MGIGGFDLKVAGDRIFLFDHAGSGHADHLLAYRPGNGAVSILKRNGGVFEAVFSEPVGGKGIGGFNPDNPADQGFAFDYDSSGKLDHLVFYRPGSGALFIIRHDDKGVSARYMRRGRPGKASAALIFPARRTRCLRMTTTAGAAWIIWCCIARVPAGSAS